MIKDFLEKRITELTKLGGYEKPPKISGSLKLDSNENFVISRLFQQDLIDAAKMKCDVREYPLGGTEKLVNQLSKFLKVPTNMVGVGNGSDQILDLFLANFCTKQTRILTTDPTFSFFEERCKLYRIPMIRVPFSDKMTIEVDDFLAKTKNADLIYIDSPNNPTGFQFTRNDIQKIIKKFRGPIIIDEAYGEFSDYSTVNLVKNNKNLIVIRTFSKAYGLAGLRLGYFVASRKFTDAFSKIIQYPYPLNSFAIEMGILALQKSRQISGVFSLIKKERERIIRNLRQYDAFDVFDSKANYVLFDAKGSDRRVYNALTEQGISIRRLGKLGKHKGCLRVTVGTKDMNSEFLLAIRDLLK